MFNSIQVIYAKEDGHFESIVEGMIGGTLAQSVPLHGNTIDSTLKCHCADVKCRSIDNIIEGDHHLSRVCVKGKVDNAWGRSISNEVSHSYGFRCGDLDA